MKKIAIIGGGAAGLAAAIAAGNELARLGAADECEIVILATGNGRCNFSNAHIDPACYCNADFVEAALRSLARLSEVSEWGSVQPAGAYGASAQGSAQPAGTSEALGRESAQPASVFEAPVQRFFSSLGLMWREEGEGRMYPAANKASSVLDVLRAALDVSWSSGNPFVRSRRLREGRAASTCDFPTAQSPMPKRSSSLSAGAA